MYTSAGGRVWPGRPPKSCREKGATGVQGERIDGGDPGKDKKRH